MLEICKNYAKADNTEIAVLHGEFETLMDLDDYLDEHYLENLVDIIAKENCDIVCSKQYKVSQSGDIINTIKFKSVNVKCLMRRLNISGRIYRTKYIQK